MNTRTYDSATRKNMKRDQRSPAYQARRKALVAKRAAIEAQLSELNKTKPASREDEKYPAYAAEKAKLVAQFESLKTT